MKTKAFLFVILAVVFSCEKNPDIQQGPKEINVDKTTSEIIKSDNIFGIELFQQVVKQGAESDNIFISPTSVALALAMTYNGAVGDTKIAMENAMRKHGLTTGEINASYKSLINALVSVDPKVLLEIANSIWYRENFDVLPEFISVNQEFYDAQVSSLDFDSPDAPWIINDWVSDKTHEKIKSIIDQIPPEAVMYLVNAIYFKGIWQYEFDETKTMNEPFYLNDETQVSVPMMKQTVSLRHTSNEQFSMAELPYGQGNYSMLVLLPHSGYTADDILSNLTPENWDEWIDRLTEKSLDIQLPKFTFEYKNVLNDELDIMGMGIAFTDQADFTKINSGGNLFISKVLHKSFVEVNEEGTEAAAVTSVEISLTSFPDNNLFRADHPFLFAIREIKTGTILFIGLVRNPLVEENG
jgi:serine protease inhibitor